jgi:LysM repeat protein
MFFQHKRSFMIGLLALLTLLITSSLSAQDTRTQACTPTQPEGWVVYVIQEGDNLSDIADRAGTSIEALQRANCIENPRRIVAGQRLYVPVPPVERPINHFLRRCLNAGFTEQQCRRIWNALHNGDDHTFAERCLNAGYTPEECRRIWNALHDDDHNLAERCRAAGYTLEECRRLYNANNNQEPT